MANYHEILKLREKMDIAGIPYDFNNLFDGHHLIYPNQEKFVCSVIEHENSYGSADDKLEIMGLLTPEEEDEDSVVGFLSAEEVFKRIENDWKINN